MVKFNFKIIINTKGFHTKRCEIYPNKLTKLEAILFTFPSSSKLEKFKSEILVAMKNKTRTYTGINAFECYVTNDLCEIVYAYNSESTTSVSTIIVLDFIDKAIQFCKLYENGNIPSIIPDLKKDEWVIVPNEYVKDEYWKLMKTGRPEENKA